MRILYEKPSHGYLLIRELEEKSCGCHKLETGSMYTLLRRMEHRGLVESEWKRSESTGPERRIYRVTDIGREALRNGLESIAKRKAMMDDLAEFYRKHFPEAEKGGEKT
jgi:DNA-binding PadR family transcriptional regulator